MKRQYFAAVCVMLAGCSDSGVHRSGSEQMPAATACAARSGLTVQKFCRASIYSVLGNPSQYDGQIIELVGYVGVVDGVPHVFPTEESLRRLDIASGIELRGAPSFSEGWFSVFGKFSKRNQANEGMAYGVIETEALRQR
jgi:hypothetical protein